MIQLLQVASFENVTESFAQLKLIPNGLLKFLPRINFATKPFATGILRFIDLVSFPTVTEIFASTCPIGFNLFPLAVIKSFPFQGSTFKPIFVACPMDMIVTSAPVSMNAGVGLLFILQSTLWLCPFPTAIIVNSSYGLTFVFSCISDDIASISDIIATFPFLEKYFAWPLYWPFCSCFSSSSRFFFLQSFIKCPIFWQ